MSDRDRSCEHYTLLLGSTWRKKKRGNSLPPPWPQYSECWSWGNKSRGLWGVADLLAKLHSFKRNRNNGPFVDQMSFRPAKIKRIFLNIFHSLGMVLSDNFFLNIVTGLPAASNFKLSIPVTRVSPGCLDSTCLLLVSSCLQRRWSNHICHVSWLYYLPSPYYLALVGTFAAGDMLRNKRPFVPIAFHEFF